MQKLNHISCLSADTRWWETPRGNAFLLPPFIPPHHGSLKSKSHPWLDEIYAKDKYATKQQVKQIQDLLNVWKEKGFFFNNP